MTLNIPAKERGQLRLFAVNLGDGEEFSIPKRLGQLLGGEGLDENYVELVRISDLGDLSLPDYLTQGYDIDADTLRADRARLAALDGFVLIILSLAFRDRAMTLPQMPELTLIATYGNTGPDWHSRETIETTSAEPASGTTRKTPSDAAMSGRIATYVLLFLFIFTGLFVWLAA